MIPIQLPSGKTIFLDSKQYLDMSDDDFANLIANDNGYDIEDPFAGSSIDIQRKEEVESEILLIESPDLREIEEIDSDYREK